MQVLSLAVCGSKVHDILAERSGPVAVSNVVVVFRSEDHSPLNLEIVKKRQK